jgi:hypothetical protein
MPRIFQIRGTDVGPPSITSWHLLGPILDALGMDSDLGSEPHWPPPTPTEPPTPPQRSLEVRLHDDPSTPMRDASRNALTIGSGRTCLVCTRPPASARARYCSPAHRQLAFRLRHTQLTRVDETSLRAELRRRGALVAHTVYECGQCGEQLLGERRCQTCNVFCRALGVGGRCAECEQPILLADLLELDQVR